MPNNDGLDWNTGAVLRGALASVIAFLAANALVNVMAAAPPWYTAYVFGAVCGAAAVYAKHPRKPVVVFLVFVPVLFVLLVAGSLLFSVYVMKHPIEL